MNTKQIIEKTEALIDAQRAICSAYGLSGDSSEHIYLQVFLDKFLNDKFGNEVKNAETNTHSARNDVYTLLPMLMNGQVTVE